MPFVINPKTGRKIKVGGPTYQSLAKDPKWKNKLYSPTTTFSKRTFATRKTCSEKTKYAHKGIHPGQFCGSEGGACPLTFPVNSPQRARAAIAYARYAPNPEGIKACARRIAKQKGWMDSSGTIHINGRGRGRGRGTAPRIRSKVIPKSPRKSPVPCKPCSKKW